MIFAPLSTLETMKIMKTYWGRSSPKTDLLMFFIVSKVNFGRVF
jgi:hypothetical protein